MRAALKEILRDPKAGRQRAAEGLATIQSRHTTLHRARELAEICEAVLA